MSHDMEMVAGAGEPAWLPGSARRILLVSGSDSGNWGGVAAIEVAEMVARHRPRTLLVNTVTGSAGPDAALRQGGAPGIGDVVAGRTRVVDVAFTPPGRSFIAVPAGRSAPGIVELCGAPAFRHLVGAAGRGGTLLLHVTATDLAQLSRQSAAGDGLEFDGLVLLGQASVPRNLPAGLRVLARVEQEVDLPSRPGDSEPEAGRASGFTRPSGTPAIVAGDHPRRRPRGRLEGFVDDIRKRGVARGAGGVAAVWLVAVVAVWLIWQGLSGWPAFQDDLEAPIESAVIERTAGQEGDGKEATSDGRTSVAGAGDAGAGLVGGAVDADGAEASEDTSAEVPPVAADPGVDLPYSILVASVVTYDDAAGKRDELTELGGLAFIAPTPVKNRVYYRVFAGALEEREQARDMMRRLVEQGGKDRVRDWDVRPVRLAFALGDYSSREEAEAERDRLHDSGVPAYVLSVGDSTGAVHRLYSGAFESEGAAAPADTLLSVAGQTATLVTRRGEPR